MVYVEIETPLDGETVLADVLLLREPYPLVLDWPDQGLHLIGGARE